MIVEFKNLVSSTGGIAVAGIIGAVGFVVGLIVGKVLPSVSEGLGDGEPVELYVGNLPYEVNKRDLKKIFSESGEILSARVIHNRMNGKSKGFGFVQVAGSARAAAVMKKMNGKTVKGRKIVVSEAKKNDD